MNISPIVSWLLVCLGFAIAITLTYHEQLREKERAKSELSARISSATIPILTKPKKYLRTNHSIALSQIAERMEEIHGHSDFDGLRADAKDGVLISDLLSRNCTRCGKPRNQEGDFVL